MTTLPLAHDLKLPLEAVTQKLAWLGLTGSGKTYGAMKLAELMLAAGAQIGAIDPVGVWRALRIPAPKGQSFEVVVFGGLYGDLPLQPTAGALIADVICDRGLSFVLDVSQMIPSEQQRVLRDFGARLFQRKKAEPSAIHLFLEECQEYLPQNPMGEEALTLHAFQRLWKLGRNFGIGGSLISQRPQEINKKALNMSGTLFAFQMTGPQERKAVREWIADHGIAADIESHLQKLKTGEPHVESPTFLGVSKTVKILPRVTADLSSTPKVGAQMAARKPLTPIDVEQLKVSMAATIEKAKAEDPKALRAKIAQLEAENRKWQRATPQKSEILATDKTIQRTQAATIRGLQKALEAAMKFIITISAQSFDVAGVDKAELEKAVAAAVERAAQLVDGRLKAREAQLLRLRDQAQHLVKMLKAVAETPDVELTVEVTKNQPFTVAQAPPKRHVQTSGHRSTDASGNLTGPEQRILDAMAWLESLGQSDCDQAAVAFLAGYTVGGGAFNNPRGALNTKGLLAYRNGRLTLTEAGRQHANAPAQALTTDELQRRVIDRLPGPEAKILSVLITAYPQSLSNDDLARQAGYEPGGGAFNNPRGRLRTLGLINYPERGQVKAQPVLFLE